MHELLYADVLAVLSEGGLVSSGCELLDVSDGLQLHLAVAVVVLLVFVRAEEAEEVTGGGVVDWGSVALDVLSEGMTDYACY